MNFTGIINSLMRIDGVSGAPSLPFEQPNDKLDFWVLEIAPHDEVSTWCERTAKTLSVHSEFLRKMQASGATATLYVTFAAATPVFRLEADFLSVLGDAGIALETSQEDAS